MACNGIVFQRVAVLRSEDGFNAAFVAHVLSARRFYLCCEDAHPAFNSNAWACCCAGSFDSRGPGSLATGGGDVVLAGCGTWSRHQFEAELLVWPANLPQYTVEASAATVVSTAAVVLVLWKPRTRHTVAAYMCRPSQCSSSSAADHEGFRSRVASVQQVRPAVLGSQLLFDV